jgi:hypothetical protein
VILGLLNFAKALRINSALRKMNLFRNRIGDEGAQAIAEEMNFNFSLQKMDLMWNEIGSKNLEICV